MSKTLDEFLVKIPEEFRCNLSLLEDFKGNRTLVLFKFACGCETKQLLKGILNLKNFQYCFYCKSKYLEKMVCKYCQTEFIQLKMYEQCILKCKEKYSNLQENIDYVICQICGYHQKSLGYHLNVSHELSTKEYKRQFLNCYVTSSKSSENYSNSAIENGSWIVKAQEREEDLTEYWKKVSDGVKKAILDDPEEKQRRAYVMTKVNQSDVMRQKASETAKKTSARPEIQKIRAEKLAKWRKENPENFHNKCVKPMITTFQSKPEKKLFECVLSLSGFNFKRNQFVKLNDFSNTYKRKQIDMADKEKRIYIEFDGQIHFYDFFGKIKFKEIQQKDIELDQHILNHNWTLIRVSHDQFLYKTKQIDKVKQDASYFKPECLIKLTEILNSGVPGLYKIGEAYGQH